MRDRVDRLGVSEPEIRTQGSNQITIQLPGVKDPEAAAKIIGKTAQLELFDLETSLVAPSIDINGNPQPRASVYDLLAGQQAIVKGKSDQWWVFDKKKKLVVGPVSSKEKALAKYDGELPDGYKLFGTPNGTVVISCGVQAQVVCPGRRGGPPANSYYLFKYDPPDVPQMTGADLKLSGTRQDFDTTTNQPIVSLEFTNKGSDRFQEITRSEYVRGKLRNAPQHFAIVLDREIRSWPQIDYTDGALAGGISGQRPDHGDRRHPGGEGSRARAPDRCAAGRVRHARPDRDLGHARQGLARTRRRPPRSSACSSSRSSCSSSTASSASSPCSGSASTPPSSTPRSSLFNVTLTLPGFAGLVLTLGVAADANVVIFERIKEEARAGRSIRAAIQTGYTKGFATIVDANVVTAITALVLFAVATSSVRGFALMLLIGTAISMLTAVLATRAFLSLLAGSKLPRQPARDRHLRWRHPAVAQDRLHQPPAAVVRDLGRRDRGLDPRARRSAGSTSGSTSRAAPRSASRRPPRPRSRTVRKQAAAGRPGERRRSRAVAPRRTATTRASRFAPRRSRATRRRSSRQDLKKAVNADAFGVKNVSSSFGRQIAKSAILAIIVSLLLIVGYISIRFQWQFAVPAIVALIHDILITVGIYALLGREVTTATVAAVLTVLGYSIYDTIIIFDRIRENIPLMKRGSFRQITNVSLWETIPRSLATTFITLLPIVALLIFGGATLNDFAFALLIGIASGAYSSIFVAAPLLDWLKEREPEFARRKHEELGRRPVGRRRVVVVADARRSSPRPRSCSAPDPPPAAVAPAAPASSARAASAVAPAARAARTAAPADARRRGPKAYTAAMDGNGTPSRHAEPRTFEQLLLAGFGWLSLTAEAADDVADDLARRVGIERDAMRNAVRDAVASWRAEAERIGSMPVGRLRQGHAAPRARPA